MEILGLTVVLFIIVGLVYFVRKLVFTEIDPLGISPLDVQIKKDVPEPVKEVVTPVVVKEVPKPIKEVVAPVKKTKTPTKLKAKN